jgi:hypothetical protein
MEESENSSDERLVEEYQNSSKGEFYRRILAFLTALQAAAPPFLHHQELERVLNRNDWPHFTSASFFLLPSVHLNLDFQKPLSQGWFKF